MSEVFHHQEDDRRYDVLKMEHLTQNNMNQFNGNNDIETAIEEEREEQEVHQRIPRPRPRANKQYDYRSTFYSSSTSPSTTSRNIYTDDRISNTMWVFWIDYLLCGCIKFVSITEIKVMKPLLWHHQLYQPLFHVAIRTPSSTVSPIRTWHTPRTITTRSTGKRRRMRKGKSVSND